MQGWGGLWVGVGREGAEPRRDPSDRNAARRLSH